MKDAFSKCHPAVNFLFFVGAIGCSVVIQHPAYLLAGACCGTIYYFLLSVTLSGVIIVSIKIFFLVAKSFTKSKVHFTVVPLGLA
mgnify:CR=1 FL=1